MAADAKLVKEKILKIEEEMNGYFIERSSQVRGVLVALLAKENVVIIAPPGTSKSLMTRNLTKRIDQGSEQDYFEFLMTKFTKLEELMGPMKIKSYIEGSIEYNTAYRLPEAKIVYLDEIFKANSSVLNALLSAINERIVYTGNRPRTIPLQMVVGTSNEIPTDESLKALYDRFRLRYQAAYIKEPSNLKKLLNLNFEPPSDTRISMEELEVARAQMSFVSFPDEKQSTFCRIVYSLMEAGLRPSDRTVKECVKILKAEAYMNNHVEIDEYDMEILENVFWDNPVNRKQVRGIIFGIINPIGERVIIAAEQCNMKYLEFLKNIKEAKQENRNNIISEANNQMNTIYKEMKKDIAAMKKDGRPTGRYESMLAAVMELITVIKTEYIGV